MHQEELRELQTLLAFWERDIDKIKANPKDLQTGLGRLLDMMTEEGSHHTQVSIAALLGDGRQAEDDSWERLHMRLYARIWPASVVNS